MKYNKSCKCLDFGVFHDFFCFLQAACDETSEKAEQAFLQVLLSSTNGDNSEVV